MFLVYAWKDLNFQPSNPQFETLSSLSYKHFFGIKGFEPMNTGVKNQCLTRLAIFQK